MSTAGGHRATEELGPCVVDGELRWLSATLIAIGDPTQQGGCPRKWHGRHVEEWDDPGTGSQGLGKAVHDVLETFLREGTWKPDNPRAMRIAMAGARFLAPHRGERMLIEQSLLMPDEATAIRNDLRPALYLSAAGVPVAGHIDLLRFAERYITPTGEMRDETPGTVEVLDHKTTKDFKWAKTGPGLLDTVQMVLYAEWVARRWNAQHLRLSHVSYKTSGSPEAMKSTTCVPREDIARRWERIESAAGTLVQIARVPRGSFNTVDANTNACAAFNRPCAYADRCDAQHRKYLTDFQGGSVSNSLLDMFDEPTPPVAALDLNAEMAKIEAEEAAKRAAVPATPAAPPPAPAVDPAFAAAVAALQACSAQPAPDGTPWGFPTIGGEVAQLKGRLEGLQITDGAALLGTGKLAKLAQINDPVAFIALARDLSKKLGVTPPAAAAPAPVVSGFLPPDAPASKPELAAKPIDPPAPATAAEASKPAKRGRPRKAAPAPGQTPDALPTELTADFELYIDCVPSVNFTNLDTYCAELCNELCTEFKVVDVRCAPEDKEHPLAFGRWRGVVASMARSEPPTGVCVIICDTEVKREIAAALAPLARAGARGVQR